MYMHKFPNGKVYIGITSQPVEERWRGGEGYKAQAVYRAIQKYGWSNIEHIVIKTGLTKEQAEQEEIRLIKEFSSNDPEHGYNIDNGGNCYGTHSEETRAKIAQKNREWVRSKETCERISKEKRGEKISQAMQARNVERPEIMEKMREKSAAKCSKPIAQTDKNGSLIKVWESGAAVARAFGVSNTHVSRVCRNKGTLYRGCFWPFL